MRQMDGEEEINYNMRCIETENMILVDTYIDG